MTVKNVNGSSRYAHPSNCKSWLNYWEKAYEVLNPQKSYNCPACGQLVFCNELVGAHVRKANSTDNSMYIAPICRGCNNKTDSFDIDVKYMLPVPSNR